MPKLILISDLCLLTTERNW